MSRSLSQASIRSGAPSPVQLRQSLSPVPEVSALSLLPSGIYTRADGIHEDDEVNADSDIDHKGDDIDAGSDANPVDIGHSV